MPLPLLLLPNWLFLSTPSARRATEDVQHLNLHTFNFYPRPPRGGRRANAIDKTTNTNISIHALREEGDHLPSFCANSLILFLSTPSARRATSAMYEYGNNTAISIHALREEGDKELYLTGTDTDISIHALREEGD